MDKACVETRTGEIHHRLQLLAHRVDVAQQPVEPCQILFLLGDGQMRSLPHALEPDPPLVSCELSCNLLRLLKRATLLDAVLGCQHREVVGLRYLQRRRRSCCIGFGATWHQDRPGHSVGPHESGLPLLDHRLRLRLPLRPNRHLLPRSIHVLVGHDELFVVLDLGCSPDACGLRHDGLLLHCGLPPLPGDLLPHEAENLHGGGAHQAEDDQSIAATSRSHLADARRTAGEDKSHDEFEAQMP
mmetsp:Transcript_70869/g.196885  ORF Transcript_70869/g.196885 Transcript_70869/m.196885 type:complete len:243 (-) Transcript_70869:15-743(-)